MRNLATARQSLPSWEMRWRLGVGEHTLYMKTYVLIYVIWKLGTDKTQVFNLYGL